MALGKSRKRRRDRENETRLGKDDTIEALLVFLDRAAGDSCIGPAHISLFAAILYCYHYQNCRSPVHVSAIELQKLAKIAGRTYYSCIKHLASHGYCVYEPSYSPKKGIRIYLGDEKIKKRRNG